MPGKVLIVDWSGSAYDSLRGLLRLAGEELAGQGFEIRTVTFGSPGWDQALTAELGTGGISFALGMSGVGSDLFTTEKKLLWESANVPFFNWNCDHPCYYVGRHRIRSQFLLHGYVFPDHARYSLRHLNANAATYAVHMGIPPRHIFPERTGAAADRNGRLLFSKSGQDTNAIEARWKGAPEPIRDLLPQAAEELRASATSRFLPVLQDLATPYGLFIDGNGEFAIQLIRELDAYTRFRRAETVVRALLPYPVDVHGTGWDHIDWSGARARLHGPVAWNEMLRILPRYLGGVSVNPLVDESVHDRVFFALAAGVVPVSDSNAFSRMELPELEPYAFEVTPECVRAAADAVLSDPQRAIDRTEAAHDRLWACFSMAQSVRQIVQFVSQRGLNARCDV